MTATLHPAAAEGYRQASDAYERGRPTYPEPAVDCLIHALDISAGRTVVELGAGTGKFTRLLLGTGARLIAVEPVEAMRRKLHEIPGIEVLAGQAEAIPLPDGSAHAVVVAQAFHWFRGPEALTEIHRILGAGGSLGLIWNRREDDHPWEKKINALLARHQENAPRYRSGEWKDAFLGSALFSSLHCQAYAHEQKLSRAGVIDRIASISYIAALPEAERARALGEFQEILDSSPDTRAKSEISLRYTTDVYWSAAL